MSETLGLADATAEIVISEIKEDTDEPKTLINVDNIVKHSEEMLIMAERLAKNYEDDEAAGTLIDLVSPYMEQPQLLDPTLGKLMKCLTSACIESFGKQFPDMIYMCIYTLSNVRGFRELLPLFPNQVELFEPVTKAFCQEIPTWEIKFVLCLWLSQLSLVPFDISTIGPTLASDLITWGTKLLHSATRDAEAAAFFLSRFVSRKDMVEFRRTFIHDACKQIKESTSERLVTSYLRTLFHIFNGADRSWVPEFGQLIFDSTSHLDESPSAHHRLYHIKIIQQVGIAYLPPRVAQWRYQRGSRILKKDTENKAEAGTNDANVTAQQEDALYKNEDEFYVEPLVEDILALLFDSLKSNLTVVRWSASKGIGRIVERLPFEDASQAVEYLFSLFDQMDNDNLIHGACLCLAQFTLRGIILPSNLSKVLPLVMQALVYDVATGSHTVAEGVRDSGCFVAWALARSYDGPTLEPYCALLSQQLVNVFLFDRCVNVRRSASAAFQENVGRHGRFPRGLELIHIADFITVSSRVGCYTRIAKFVAQFPEYGPSMMKHLVNDRMKSWDEEIRVLAGKSIALLAKEYPQLITEDIINEICVSCCAINVDVKHGGIEALGDLLQVKDLPQDQIEPLLTLDESYQIDSIKCSFIKLTAAAERNGHKVPNFPELMNNWLQTGSPVVQEAAVHALTYLNQSENHILDEAFFHGLVDFLDNQGVASAVAAIPAWFMKENVHKIVEKIKSIFAKKDSSTDTKKNFMKCIDYLSQYCSDEDTIKLLTMGLNDRTVTKKGDEGSYIRTEALQAIPPLLKKKPIANAVLKDVLKLCLDRISGLRELAFTVLRTIVDSTPDLDHRESLLKVLNTKNLSVEHFNQLIVIPDFAAIVVEGLIYCSGAYAPDLSKRARNALLSFMRKKGTDNVSLVSSIIIELYRKQWGIVIFQSSLFAFLPLLLSNGILNGENLKKFANEFISITEQKYFNKPSPQKNQRICKVLAALAATCETEEMKRAFTLLAPFFVSDVPSLRESSANELYANLKTRVTSGNPLPFNFDEIQDILTKTQWKLDFSNCAESIPKLCEIYGVPVPKFTAPAQAQQVEKNKYDYAAMIQSLH